MLLGIGWSVQHKATVCQSSSDNQLTVSQLALWSADYIGIWAPKIQVTDGQTSGNNQGPVTRLVRGWPWSTDHWLTISWLHWSWGALRPTSPLCLCLWQMLLCHAQLYISNWLHYNHHTLSHGVWRNVSLVTTTPHPAPAHVWILYSRHERKHYLDSQRSGVNCWHVPRSLPDLCFIVRKRLCCWLVHGLVTVSLIESFDITEGYWWAILLMWQLQSAGQKIFIGWSTSNIWSADCQF